MLKFLFGIFIGWVLFGGSCEARPVDVGVKMAIYKVSTDCHAHPYDAIYPALTEARRLMVRDGWEYGGVLARRPGDGYWCVSPPATSEHPTRLMFTYHLPEGYVLSGMYHSHPGDDLATYLFSGTDVVSTCLLRVPSYIVTETRLVLAFVPTAAECLVDPVKSVGGRVIGLVRP